ncbi:helix-turn-helix domain-containing protein [Globicatella sanguinis]|uniref:helix-turn-helix domain-containing protein n=1 Tax=Globicatella sanguinis TaxID=13076 RepID=UPI000C798810|nr:helix-turn-helix transcriptional regulator [Globicatella sanguinis]MDK7631159.1 helix-turn-helix transcriptional regulator [Globicatella sanguinis]WIK67438.1 helix-turn-helix transcriptional regulator [Globicatella sanguinis]WKT56843.1 helix-turn-helix transcriptional regulator [Globicatella sanguinis]
MEIDERIKTHRTQLNLSQEALAEKVYVTRQTISNWENNKSYPDINSLLRLGEVFDITMDQLLKGDLEIMKEKINSTDIQKMKAMSIVYGGLLLLSVISLPILFHYMNWKALYVWLPILAITILQCI